jgi:hypothetical protein
VGGVYIKNIVTVICFSVLYLFLLCFVGIGECKHFLVGKKEPNPARAGHKQRIIQHRRLIRRDEALVLLLIVHWNIFEL